MKVLKLSKIFKMVVCTLCGMEEGDCRRFHAPPSPPYVEPLPTPSYPPYAYVEPLPTPSYAPPSPPYAYVEPLLTPSYATPSPYWQKHTNTYAPSANGLLFLDFDLDEDSPKKRRPRAEEEQVEEDRKHPHIDNDASEDEW